MKNPTTKQKLRAVFKAALLGVALSLVFTLLASHPPQGGDGLGWCLIFLMPTAILSDTLGFEGTPGGRMISHSDAFMVISNVLLITFVFIVFACFWQFVVKRRGKNQTTENK
jgi:Na+/phosphate symporter